MKDLQVKDGSPAETGRSRRRQKMLSETGSFLCGHLLESWSSFLEKLGKENGVGMDDL